MATVFINYRRDDSQGFAGRLADGLGERFGNERVFRDIEIPIGSDFTEILHRAVAACDVLLVVIGRRWLIANSTSGRSRLFDTNDWVRTEIEAALASNKRVVPVLVGGAHMPAADELPDSIRRLSRYQAAVLDDRHWDANVDDLVDRLGVLCPSLRQRADTSTKRGDPLSGILEELNQRLAQGRQREKPSAPSGPQRSWGSRLLSSMISSALGKLGRGIKQVVGFAILAALVYLGMRLFGDQALLRELDAFEQRLLIGWERVRQYFSP